MIIYYAHPMSWYGTPEEIADVNAILAQHPDPKDRVENPSGKGWLEKVLRWRRSGDPMRPFRDYVQHTANAVAFRRFLDGKIGAGVATEVLEAMKWGKPVWELRTYAEGVRLVKSDPFAIDMKDVLSIADTKARISKGEL